MVQGNDWGRLDVMQAGVERGDLRPVGGIRDRVQRGDGGLDLEGAGRATGDGAVEKAKPFVELIAWFQRLRSCRAGGWVWHLRVQCELQRGPG